LPYKRVIKDIITRMNNYNTADIASLVPDPDDLLKLNVEEHGRLILKLLAPCDSPQKAVASSNFFSRTNDYMYQPKYGNIARPLTSKRLMPSTISG